MIDPYDLRALFGLRAIIQALDPIGAPEFVTLHGAPLARNVALLPGSFNPVTAAHVMLAERAIADGFDIVVYTLAVETTGKASSGLSLEDRLLSLEAVAGDRTITGVVSHGLYADQAEAAASLFPQAEISFLVGSDKVMQIFDADWYDDRDQALDRLFSHARLVCAPRADHGDQLRETLTSAHNHRWADRVEVLRLHPAVNDLSSTRVRGLLHAGAEPAGLVPSAVSDLLAEVRAFMPPLSRGSEEVDAYAVRTALIDALWRLGARDDELDLAALVDLATGSSEEGAALRARLRGDQIDEDVIRSAMAAPRG